MTLLHHYESHIMKFTMVKCRRGRWYRTLFNRNIIFFVIILVLFISMPPERTPCDPFINYTYINVSNIIKDIKTTGTARMIPVNTNFDIYKPLLDPKEALCYKYKCQDVDMIFIIKSHAKHSRQRRAIRRTWGGVQEMRLITVFILGLYPDIENDINKEFKRYSDILLLNFEDHYINLVHKTIGSSMWLCANKINVRFVHFIDDDRIVNTMNVYSTAVATILPTDEKIIGHKLTHSLPRRQKQSKHYVAIEDYSATYYPPYLIGGTLLTNIKVVDLIVSAVPFVKIIYIEDAYIGIVCHLLGIELHHHSGFLAFYEDAYKLAEKLSSPGYDNDLHILQGWNILQNTLKKNEEKTF